MPQDQTIQAQSADGTIHEFPAGTPRTVIDGVMKKYAASQNAATKQTPPTPERPGFFKRLGQSVGAPTTKEELAALKPSTAEMILGPGAAVPKMLYDYLKKNIKSTGQEIGEVVDAGKNIAQGQPILPNVGKAAYGMLHGELEKVPVVGSAINTAGSDVANKNYMGAAGGLTGVIGQIALPDAIEKGGEAFGKVTGKVNPAVKVNKILGVKDANIRVGSVPASMDEFATNPARGVMKYGLDEKTLNKMNPIERLKAVTDTRNQVGAKLDTVLKAATDAGKTVKLESVVKDTFSQITDKALQANVEKRMTQILQEAGIPPGTPLNQYTPTQARALQRGLDDFANFAPEGSVKTFRDVATKLRRGISAETRKVVPESAPLDRDYGDLAEATKATKKTVSKAARTVPENKLRKWIIRGLAGAGAYEVAKHSGVPLP
jgi:hypothetical protein